MDTAQDTTADVDPDLDPLEDLLRLVEGLVDRVDALEARLTEDESDLDPAQLAEWVIWLVAAYRLEDVIRPGWETVPGVRQELEALRAAWHTAHDPEGRPQKRFDAVQWHDALARVLARIRDPWYHAERGRESAATGTRRPVAHQSLQPDDSDRPDESQDVEAPE